MVTLIRGFNLSDYDLILDFYKRMDKEYFPKISERKGGLEGHMLNIINNGGTFCLYEVDGNIDGVAGWLPLDREKNIIQFTFFTFSERLRNTLAPYRMVKYLAERREEYGYGHTKTIIVRTWYEESADRLTRMGMRQVAVIRGDIIPERTSYYFEGYLDLIVNNIFNRRILPRNLTKK